MCPDSKIAAKMSCDYTKCTELVNNVTGRTNFDELISKMRNNKFSVLVVESTV